MTRRWECLPLRGSTNRRLAPFIALPHIYTKQQIFGPGMSLDNNNNNNNNGIHTVYLSTFTDALERVIIHRSTSNPSIISSFDYQHLKHYISSQLNWESVLHQTIRLLSLQPRWSYLLFQRYLPFVDVPYVKHLFRTDATLQQRVINALQNLVSIKTSKKLYFLFFFALNNFFISKIETKG